MARFSDGVPALGRCADSSSGRWVPEGGVSTTAQLSPAAVGVWKNGPGTAVSGASQSACAACHHLRMGHAIARDFICHGTAFNDRVRRLWGLANSVAMQRRCAAPFANVLCLLHCTQAALVLTSFLDTAFSVHGTPLVLLSLQFFLVPHLGCLWACQFPLHFLVSEPACPHGVLCLLPHRLVGRDVLTLRDPGAGGGWVFWKFWMGWDVFLVYGC